MAYPQASINMDMYMEIPDGILPKEGDQKEHVLKLLANLYGQKEAGRVWTMILSTNSLKLTSNNLKLMIVSFMVVT